MTLNYANNIIVSCSGPTLNADEASLFAELKPWAIILFARNLVNSEQIIGLIEDIKVASARDDLPVLIDQEGGRVSRLPQTGWRVPPSPAVFAKLYKQDKAKALRACYINNQLIGHELKTLGINVNCAPMLDVPQADAAGIIHERAFGDNVEQVIALSEQVIKGLQASSVEPVIKHIPGHGRGRSDSHFTLPRVEASLEELSLIDFKPFEAHRDVSMAMTAHIVYEAIDQAMPASISQKVINTIIRERIGFDGLLMTDDINMHALSGTVAERVRSSIDAGVDVALHCSGDFAEMRALLPELSALDDKSLARAKQAAKQANVPSPELDIERLYAELETLLS